MTQITTGKEENIYGVRVLGYAEFTLYLIQKVIEKYGINVFKKIATADKDDIINFIFNLTYTCPYGWVFFFRLIL